MTAQAARQTVAEHLRGHRWRAAADAFGALPAPLRDSDLSLLMQSRLARNMAALQEQRPVVYERLIQAPATGACQLAVGADGAMSIVQSIGAGKPVWLSPNRQPKAGLAEAWRRVSEHLSRGVSLAILGIGDGCLLNRMGQPDQPVCTHAPGQLPAVFIIEPDPQIISFVFMIHDLTGPDGAIASDRFVWCLGEDWPDQLHAALVSDPFIQYPGMTVLQSIRSGVFSAGLQRVSAQLTAMERQQQQMIEAIYARRDRDELVTLLAPHGPRVPRALLLTSRYTTVLQHSTGDIADALGRMGWQTRVLAEPRPHHVMPDRALRGALIEFEPDVVITIDHLRRERPGVFPEALPFVCWIQDDLPNLTDPAAGASIGASDFVLTCAPAWYGGAFGYRARQCVYLNKVTRVPDARASDGAFVPASGTKIPDVVFVSNASAQPRLVVEQFLAATDNPMLRQVVSHAADELMRLYDAGGCMVSMRQSRGLIRAAQERLGIRLRVAHAEEQLSLWLFNSLNNPLYRQQALRWVVEACEKRGATLGFFGRGWEAHPDFARWARGPVAYGPALEDLTRHASINLQIVPFSCLHQRLLDGLVADGFFLVRRHPFDSLPPDLASFIDRRLDPAIESVAEALSRLGASDADELRELLRRREELDEHMATDPITAYRQHQAQGLSYIYAVPPRLDEVCFGDTAEFDALLDRFLREPESARSIRAEQRRFVTEHYTYLAAFRRVMPRIASLLKKGYASI